MNKGIRIVILFFLFLILFKSHNFQIEAATIPITTTVPVSTNTPTLINTPASTSTPVPTITQAPDCALKSQGDANCDEKIDKVDFEIWKCQMNAHDSSCGAVAQAANFDLLNGVNLNDYEIWRRNYQQVAPTNTPIPQPAEESNVTPIITTECYFCGTSCVIYNPKIKVACPDVMPPQGATCSYNSTTNTCVITYDGGDTGAVND